MKSNVLFFSRTDYAYLFPRLKSEKYNAFHVTQNVEEKAIVEGLGGKVIGCMEEEFEELEPSEVPPDFLRDSYFSDRFLGWLDIDERLEIIGKSIAFWDRILSEREYLGGVHETIAIEAEEIFSLMLTRHGVKDLNFIVSIIPDSFFWKPSAYNSSIPQELLDSQNPAESHRVIAQDILGKTKIKGHKPFFIANPPRRQQRSKIRILASILKYLLKSNLGLNSKPSHQDRKIDSLFYGNKKATHFNFFQLKIDQFYQQSTDYVNYKQIKNYKWILFPFHFEPESTLLYFNPQLSNQYHVIQQILLNLPLDHILLVKEHPYQPGYLMKKEYRELALNNSNLAYVTAEEDSFSLIQKVKAVVTVSGSVGWEALVNNVPVIVLGNVYYDKHPDVYKLKSIDHLGDILKQEDLRKPTDENTLSYLSKFACLNQEGSPCDKSKYDDPENINCLVKAIEKQLEI